ncbi:MAG: SAF domain-containing protein [Microbacterium sp.]
MTSDTARPSRRRPWGDARFLLGLLLVAASIAGVWFVVAAARSTTPVLAAAHTIVPGAVVTDADVLVVDVALGQSGGAYIEPVDLVPGLVATRTIDEGELVPAAALDDAATARTTTVVLRSAADVPASVGPGSVVEVWRAPLLESGAYDEPRILVADATVVSVTRDESMMGGGSAALEIVIARSDVAAVLAAIADGSSLSVVPTSGASR